jgi:hypothetical protein
MKDMNYPVDKCTLIDFRTIKTDAGSITHALRNGIEIPFAVKRMYYMYDIPVEKSRGGHAHKNLQQVVIALKGSFSLKLHDGYRSKIVRLDNPQTGLYLVRGIWREVFGFAPGAICMVLASEVYTESDYIRNYEDYLAWKNVYQCY